MRAWRKAGGGITFAKANSYASSAPLDLPCGQCIGCRINKSQQWAIRCVHEAQMYDRNSFVTLTYSPESIPTDGGLDIAHWQLFAKKLRQKIGSFRFFMCGEYGEENLRPHYHICIFGLDFSGDRTLLRSDGGNPLYKSALLADTWNLGFTSVGDLTFQSAAYVARYCMKKLSPGNSVESKQKFEDKYGRTDPATGEFSIVKPEFINMSRRPGIGASWLKKYKSDVYPGDSIRLNGKKMPVPRFYDSQIPDAEIAIYKAQRRLKIDRRHKDLTADRLVVAETVLKEKMKLCERNL